VDYLWRKFAVVLGYIANYGYTDGSGDYYITIDSDKCDGCAKCVEVCPQAVLEVITDDYDELVAKVRDDCVHNLKYLCAVCKPVSGPRELPCQDACPWESITHSW